MQTQTTRIYLYGALRKYCNNQPYVDLVAPSIKMGVQGLVMRFGEGVKDLIENNNWQIYSKKYVGDKSEKYSFSEDDILKNHGKDALHFYPVVEGRGKLGRIIVGVALTIVGIWYGITSGDWGTASKIIMAGVGNILLAVFAPSMPKMQDPEENRASFLFNTPVNSYAQGVGVPLVYGRFRTGSVVVSAGIDVEQMMTTSSPYEGSTPVGGGAGGGGTSSGGNIFPDEDYFDRFNNEPV